SVTRTVTRVGSSVGNMVNFAFTPEYSFIFGRKDWKLMRSYIRLHGAIASIGSVAYLLVISTAGAWSVDLLSRGKVTPDKLLLLVMSAGVVAEMLWSAMF